MRQILGIGLILTFAGIALAQDSVPPGGPALPEWNVLYGRKEFANAQNMFSSYIRKLIENERQRRSKAIADLSSAEEIREYQREARGRLLTAMSGFPAQTPLNPQTAGILERDGYKVEKVIFESRPRYYVTANVYVPRKGSPPYPAVLAPVGHWGMGKSFEEYQRLGIYLVRGGYIVLVYAAPGQGERTQYFNPILGRSLIDPGG